MEMEILSLQFLSALLAVIVIDLVLAGDNAIVIGLAARNLPVELRKKAIFWGAIGAVVVRTILTAGVVWILKIPGFLLVGGLALVWIAYQMEAEDDADAHSNVAPAASFRAAIQTIIVADAIMGVDNVLGVAGAAHGSMLLVVFGLLFSIPIVMMGSNLILKLVERYPVIINIGAAVLAWTAAKMLTTEPMLKTFFEEHANWRWALYAFFIGLILVVPLLRKVRGRLSAIPVSVVVVGGWLYMFYYLKNYTTQRYFPSGNAPTSMYLVDVAMWLGWIPIVWLLYRELAPKKMVETATPSAS